MIEWATSAIVSQDGSGFGLGSNTAFFEVYIFKKLIISAIYIPIWSRSQSTEPTEHCSHDSRDYQFNFLRKPKLLLTEKQ